MCLGAVFVLASVRAQEDLAAALRVVYAGVEVRRDGTDAWLPLRQGAEMPFGAGDAVRTDRTGRALLLLADRGEILILPESVYAVELFDRDRVDGWTFSGYARQGQTIHQLSESIQHTVRTDQLTLGITSHYFAVQALPSGLSRVIAAEGGLGVMIGDTLLTLEAGQGIIVGQGEISPVINVPYPANFARLDGIINGCPGVVQARGERDLNVRVGPSLAYDAIGVLVNDTSVQLMAVSEFGERYRIQYLSGYGTILATGVVTTCRDLPVIPYNSVETYYSIVDPTQRELQLLRPFYGTPEDDSVFYRGILPPQD